MCGCDQNNDGGYIDSIIGNGTESAMNASLSRVADVNGTRTLIINGTLPNGTTAAGGSVSATSTAVARAVLENSGYWVMGAIVVYSVWFL